MTEKSASVSRRYYVGIASVALTAFAGPAFADDATSPDVFLGAMSGCLDWIAEGATDQVPFDGWIVETAFPDGRTEDGAEAGAYRDPASALTVSMERGAERIACSGQNSGVTMESLGQDINAWVMAETEAGRIGVVTEGAAEFGYALAVCVGKTGGADILRAEDESLIFYFDAGGVTPPEGVCNA